MNPADGRVAKIVGPGTTIGYYGQPTEIVSAVAFLAGAENVADGR